MFLIAILGLSQSLQQIIRASFKKTFFEKTI